MTPLKCQRHLARMLENRHERLKLLDGVAGKEIAAIGVRADIAALTYALDHVGWPDRPGGQPR